jgi:hypothetical protein
VNALWGYFWPVFAAALVSGGIGASIAFRRRKTRALAAGLAVALAAAALWHGPFGGADRLTARVERTARLALDHYEMTRVSARLHHGPLTRALILKGPADDFQRSELVRLMSQVPGVSRARWSEGSAGLPLIAEALGAAFLGFLVGVLLAYLVELRRRYNSQWNW